jgi:beta-mannosidase
LEASYAHYGRPEPFKFIHFPEASDLGLKIMIFPDGNSVSLSTQKPIKGLVLDVDGEDVRWSDQALDLIPNDPQIVMAQGLNGRRIKVRYLGSANT